MSSSCDNCANWAIADKTLYSDGSEIVTRTSPSGNGLCAKLGIETPGNFGCTAYQVGDEHVRISRKEGEPWRNFKMVPCPDCTGIDLKNTYSSPAGGRGHRCAGTGLVRLYDDGYVGDEQTRMHPKEKEFAEARRKAEELAARGESDKLDPSSMMGA